MTMNRKITEQLSLAAKHIVESGLLEDFPIFDMLANSVLFATEEAAKAEPDMRLVTVRKLDLDMPAIEDGSPVRFSIGRPMPGAALVNEKIIDTRGDIYVVSSWDVPREIYCSAIAKEENARTLAEERRELAG